MRESGGKTVLVVEDDAVSALVCADRLRSFGYRSLVAGTGQEAVELALGSGRVDLVLMDIELGEGMDGAEAARRILAARELPIVFHTAHAEQGYVDRVRQIARYGYVTKNSGDFVLRSSIEMAFELFESHASIAAKVAELRGHEAFLDILLETVPLPLFVKDRAGVYIRANKAYAEFMGMDLAAVLGKDVFGIYPPDLAEVYRRHDDELYRDGGIQTYESKVQISDGSRRDILVCKAVFRDQGGEAAGIIGVVEDVTERTRAQERVQSLLAEKDLILREVHHRIKNNMKTMEALLSLQADSQTEASARAALDDARGRIQSMIVLNDTLSRSEGSGPVQLRDYLVELLDRVL
ncbi:MAG TPA: histidine kinase dimerization/phosphoacceptor domain -containing protein, partial [Rectinemataceae bacterium]|nr:histidine kinase dimerization/phosphoacceptor domain -containing protein [Rectinemataceae bacterium]